MYAVNRADMCADMTSYNAYFAERVEIPANICQGAEPERNFHSFYLSLRREIWDLGIKFGQTSTDIIVNHGLDKFKSRNLLKVR